MSFATFQPNFMTFFKKLKMLQSSSFGFGVVGVECIFVLVVVIVVDVAVVVVCSKCNPFPIIALPELEEPAKSFEFVVFGVDSK